MIKRISPLSIVAILIAIYCIYVIIFDESGWAFIFALIVLPVFLFIWFIDVLIKKFFKPRKLVFTIESTLVLLAIGIYQYGERIKTLEIKSDYDNEFVSIVYDIEDGNDLDISIFDWSKTIKIPENGILFTSSSFDENLPRTEMKFDSGIFLGSENTEKKFIEISESEFILNSRTYKYRSWKIQEGFCCLYSSKEIENVEFQLKKELNLKIQTER